MQPFVGWGRQQQDPGEPGRCGVGSASAGSPAPGHWGCSACSALGVSGVPHSPGGLAGLPHHTAASLGLLLSRICAGNGEEWGCLVRPSTCSWELDTASSCCPGMLQGVTPSGGVCAMSLAHYPISGSPTGTKMQNNPSSGQCRSGRDGPCPPCGVPRTVPGQEPAELCNPRQDGATGQGQAQQWAEGDGPCCAHGPGAVREGLRLAAGPAACHRSYCRDLTMALRAWGVSGTEGDEL